MKKIIMFLTALMFVCFVADAQRVYTLTAYADTLTNAETANYPVYRADGSTAATFTKTHYAAAQVVVDHLTGSSDSTHVRWQASLDNTNWTTLSSTYHLYTDDTPTTWEEISFGTSDGAAVWTPTALLTWKYMRMQVQHYATGTVTVTAYLQIY